MKETESPTSVLGVTGQPIDIFLPLWVSPFIVHVSPNITLCEGKKAFLVFSG